MDKETKKKSVIEKLSFRPGVDCKCPICIFTKSQAPGEPYDLDKCPMYNAQKKSRKPSP